MRLEVIIRPQQYALLLQRPRRAIPVYQILAYILCSVAGRRYRRRVVCADLQTAGVCVWHRVLVTRLGLLALAHPRDFAQGAQHTGSVVEAVAIQLACRARAGRNGVGRCEGVRRHRVGGKSERACADTTLRWRRTRPCVSAWRFARSVTEREGLGVSR